MKKKYLVWGAIATIVGVGYYYWNKGKEERQRRKKEADDVRNATPPTESGSQANNSNLGSSSTSSAPTQAQIDLAVAYRKWANSTDALKKKWGKTSTYDLDETSNNPYNQYFLNSYNGGGKAEYEDYLKTKGSGSSSSTSTTAQAKLNKDTMDRLYMAWGGNASAKKATHSKGRDLQIFFEVSGQIFMPYRWSIIFYEYAKGESRPTYTITDGEGKFYQRGNFSFNGSKYDFSATQGTGAGQRKVTSSSLITAINSLTKRDASLA